MKVLVIGDVCRDVYHYGSTKRKNPEASAPLLNDIATEIKYGMAANVAVNLAELGAEVHTNFPPDEQWSVKKRYIDFQYGTQLLRVDHDRPSDPLGDLPDLSAYDAVVVSDYDKGFVSHEILQQLDGRIPLFVDTKKQNLGLLTAAWVKVNAHEHELIKTPPKNLVVTLGNRGSMYNGQYAPAQRIEVVDPCGAGDTYLAAFAWHMIREPDNVMGAMEFANAAAAVTCQHRGTYAPTLEEIRR
jgi:bifunctional ADP-heptose synthase (sugar kinase/adenylyltransferase)